MDHQTTILVGTTKGLFILHSDGAREAWEVTGPLFDGWAINHATDDAATGTIWAGGGGEWSGAGVWRSEDGGASWAVSKLADGTIDEWIRNDPDTAAFFNAEPKPPAPFTGKVDSIWSLGRVGQTLYAGARPAALFASTDGGETWQDVEALTNHPTRESWNPGAAGMTLHTIVAAPEDPDKLWIGISAAGVFASEDGARALKGATGCRMPKPAQTTCIRQRQEMARPGIACTTWCAPPGARICFISKTTMESGGHETEGAVGTTSPRGCPRPSGFPSRCIRASPRRCGPCP